MDLYVAISGGLGKNFSFLRVVKHLKKTYNHIFVLSLYWDVFLSSSFIDGIYKENEQRDFILEAIKNNGKLVIDRMYDDEQFIRKELDYSQAWCKMCGVEQSEPDKNIPLDNILKSFPLYKKDVDSINNILSRYEDFIIIQFYGGQSSLNRLSDNNYNPYAESLKRNYPINYAQEFIDLYKSKYPNRGIIQYGLPNEPVIEGCEHFMVSYLCYYEIAKMNNCKGFISIDSSLQHLITGVVDGVVLWGHTIPETFGYKYNKNIIQDCDRDDIFYFTLLGPSGARINYITPQELINQCIFE